MQSNACKMSTFILNTCVAITVYSETALNSVGDCVEDTTSTCAWFCLSTSI